VPEAERGQTWGGEEGPFLQVDNIGAFVRVLLPIKLTGGYSLTVGTWLAINPSELGHLWEVWNTNQYADLVLDGYLGNAIEPWGSSVLRAPVSAVVRNVDEIPWLESSTNPDLEQVLSAEWPHDPILSAWEAIT
jgi:hypothetical protein